MPSALCRFASLLALALTLLLSACGTGAPDSADESGGFGSSAQGSSDSSDSSDASTSSASETATESSPDTTTAPPAPPDSPIDVCTMVSAGNVGDVLSTTVEGTSTSAGCTYTYSDGSTGPVITAQTDTGGVLDTARAASEADVGGVAQPLDLAGDPGYIVNGMDGETFVSEGAVAVHGLVVTVSLTGGGGAEGNLALTQGLLELIVDVL